MRLAHPLPNPHLACRLRGQAVCRSLAAALAGLLPCTLMLTSRDKPEKLAWVVVHQPRVSKLGLSVDIPDMENWHYISGAHLMMGGYTSAVAAVASTVRRAVACWCTCK